MVLKRYLFIVKGEGRCVRPVQRVDLAHHFCRMHRLAA